MATIEVKQLVRSVAGLVKSLNPRNRDIVARRFGLNNGVRETLESIGKSYGITRERVRQIEEFALAQLAKTAPASRDLTRAIDGARELVAREGGVMRERSLFAAVSGTEKDSAANAALAFALSLDTTLVRVSDGDHFHAFWATDARTADSFRDQASAVIGALSGRDTVAGRSELVELAKSKGVTNLDALLAVSKDLGQNIFGELGLASWSQIHPKGVRDKAYLVIKKAAKPRHFSEIAKLINQAKFDTKKTNVQTVHNELIKDDRFVLVGRGMYALAEWGYKSGTVKDVLTDILKTHGKPLARAELVSRVGQVRLVKENTILLNLQDSGTFVRDASGNYTLRRR